MKLTTIGIDPAKNVFQVHGVDERGKPRSSALMRYPKILGPAVRAISMW